jgi:uncharacterized protein
MRPARAAATMQMALAALAFVVALVTSRPALAAFTPPPLDTPIVDPSGKIPPADAQKLNQELQSGLPTVAMAVFIAPSLDGESIDDVGYDTAKAWKLGTAGKDNGVLLVIAPNERKMRLEVGKGLEGDLPDLAANDILRQKVGPALKNNDYSQAVAGGIDGVFAALHVTPSATLPRKHYDQAQSQGGAGGLVITGIFLLVFFFVIVAAIRRRRSGYGGYDSGGSGISRAIGFGIGSSFLGGGGWGGGGGDSGGGGFGGGDSGGGGFSGGGDFGGGGSSDGF